MRRTSVPSHITSTPGHLVCPMCGSGKLGLAGLPPLASCDSCGCAFDHVVLRTLEQMVILPDVLGKHACECGHPEMGRLPDGTFHCPACRSEVVLPTEPIRRALVSPAEEGEQRGLT
jgi:hypothetical protein